ncbi:superoxide dismutase family protein [Xanthomonadaceae bacterium JHOS43]|nr:superoxide dismutase family protein [Xanthomonadaceae bacterium JHOS43]MCX7562254.1 superoxide dismutase family protein [Xanthomonadaceae bacterium XH05]
MNARARNLVVALAVACAATACSPSADPPAPPAPPPPPAAPPAPPPPPVLRASSAMAELVATEGNTATGTLTLAAESGGVHITGSLTGVAPGGMHGFHVHETGDCSAPDASSAGPHFNPEGHAHGHPGHGEHHAGDMPNLAADDSGTLVVDVQVAGITLGDGGATDILGRAIVLHASADDYTTQPAGDSGPRIACGVIR